jgi:hypothetical protein
MKVYCVTLDGVLYDIYRHWEDAKKRCDELQGPEMLMDYRLNYMVETWEVEESFNG